jgi:antirestriction protein ArdC
MQNTKTPEWAAMLSEAVNKPGVLSSAYSAFHDYSVGNQMLAWAQLHARQIPLGPIATYKRWAELGRQVKRGEKAIELIMPVTVNGKDENGEKTGRSFTFFSLKPRWFALSQTEGQDYVHEAKTPEWDSTLALAALGIEQVPFADTRGNCQGYASGREIAINPVAALPHKTRFHEIAHIILGHTAEGTMQDDERTPRDIREVEAESVAYLCVSILNLSGQDESRGYIQHWLGSEQISDKSAQKIFAAAEKILAAGRAQQ